MSGEPRCKALEVLDPSSPIGPERTRLPRRLAQDEDYPGLTRGVVVGFPITDEDHLGWGLPHQLGGGPPAWKMRVAPATEAAVHRSKVGDMRPPVQPLQLLPHRPRCRLRQAAFHLQGARPKAVRIIRTLPWLATEQVQLQD